jgi:hypothetical protein
MLHEDVGQWRLEVPKTLLPSQMPLTEEMACVESQGLYPAFYSLIIPACCTQAHAEDNLAKGVRSLYESSKVGVIHVS